MEERSIIATINAGYIYRAHTEESYDVRAVNKLSVKIKKGEFVAILGRNGSGKSTFAKMLNALIIPSEGTVYVNAIDTKNNELLWEIRKTAGMVFQNPDNQIVGTTVEEDVAFGPENLGIEPEQIRKRVDEALEITGLKEYAKYAPHQLSGGQKQRVGIAGILAMKPECIILDEATSMLDPVGRKEVIKTLKNINKNEKITIILITHHMDEASIADRVLVMNNGELVVEGDPHEVFSNIICIKNLGLDVPQVTELFWELNMEGCKLPLDVINVDEAFSCICKKIEKYKRAKVEEQDFHR